MKLTQKNYDYVVKSEPTTSEKVLATSSQFGHTFNDIHSYQSRLQYRITIIDSQSNL